MSPMKQIVKLLIFISIALLPLAAREVIPLSKTRFEIRYDNGQSRTVNLKGKEFIVVSVREPGSDGRFYAVDRDGVVWWTGAVTSGADDYKTPSGIYPVLYKKRHHMSTKYPDPSGENNMDFSIFFTHQGHALHKGSVNWMSHGCIHIDPRDICTLFRWAKPGRTHVIITRHSYMPFARPDLLRFHLK
ncbi:ErfK/YbiS/YcfS/YnhG family protein [Nitratifractor salsuginis DSM 16511]|uniref:ErfK/YbiS/YcfS/YnhG family protein n=2 Tax=Nitratifractor salsuginis TaxID=269261 RepID=E6X0E2_NITSE|nr:ErfK/YbiS/YcfS/YnhG family protein [Nitratifractor salsuginis DSM 16511]